MPCISALLAFASTAVAIPPDRADLAAAYVRFDRVALSAPSDPGTRELLNRGFDSLTADFFAGRYGKALSQLSRVESELTQADPREAAERAFLAGHRWTIEPRTLSPDSADRTPLVIRCDALDGADTGTAPTTLIVRAPGGLVEVPHADEVVLRIPAAKGVIRVSARFGELGEREVAKSFIADIPAAPDLARRIDALVPHAKCDASVIASLRSRLALLGGIDRNQSASFSCDVHALASTLPSEVTRAEAGEDPFADRGERWRVYRALGTDLCTRQYIPEGDGPFPLLVAFHGAGGDENMFFDAYGGGMLRQLAEQHRIAVVCPPTVPFGLSPVLFDRFVEAVATAAPIDRTRVLLLGHSMGAITASRLAALRPSTVTGAACIAGFTDATRGPACAPMAVYLGALDPIFGIGGVRAAIAGTRKKGHGVESVEFDHEGHTLVVDRALPQAVAWLLARPALSIDTKNPTANAPSTRPMNTGLPAPNASESMPSAGPTK